MRKIALLALVLCASPLSAETDARQEIIDWTVIAGAGAGGVALDYAPCLTERPVVGGTTGRSYRGDTVSMPWIAGGCAASGLSIALLPNTDGRLNATGYVHVKGFFAAMAFNALFTNAAKTAVGRKRPDYDAGADKNEGRKSFYSGHASFSFAAATYLSLFVVNDTALGSRYGIVPEIAVPVLLHSAAAAVAASRVKDHRHHISDVAVGAAAGSLTACGAYLWADRRLHRTAPQLSVTYEDGNPVFGAAVTLQF